MLMFSCFCLLVGDMLFGFDTGSFGGILANPVGRARTSVAPLLTCKGFVNQFGTQSAAGTWSIDSLHTSLLSSLAFIGKFIGCFAAGPLIEWVGHRKVFYGLSAVSYIGVISEGDSLRTCTDTQSRSRPLTRVWGLDGSLNSSLAGSSSTSASGWWKSP